MAASSSTSSSSTRVAALASALAAAIGWSAACGTLVDPIGPQGASDASSSVNGEEASATDGGGGGSVGEVGEAPCAPDATPPASAIYVSEKTGSAAADGTAGSPYKTISLAVAPATASGAPAIIVDEGTYAEAVVLDFPKGMILDGAWIRTGSSWVRDCSKDRRTKTILQSPTERGLTVKSALTTPIVVSNLTIKTREPAPPTPNQSGTSRYGIFAQGASLRLENVTVEAHAADDGGEAAKGANGVSRCVSATECVLSPVAGISAPPSPPASSVGAFGSLGFTPANGVAGVGVGQPGTHGTQGGTGSTAAACETGCSAPDGCQSHPGAQTSGTGRCGCGGTGGLPGTEGRGGGASIAIFADGPGIAIVVKWSELIAGKGGNGSDGGAGGAGGPATPGTGGTPLECYEPKTCIIGSCPASCGCYCKNNWNALCNDNGAPPTKTTIAGGSPGGPGRAGGNGANGGGGAGGSSYSIVGLGGAQVIVTDSKRVFGAGGTGAGGAPSGSAAEKL